MDNSILPITIIEAICLFIYLLLVMNNFASKDVPFYAKLLCVFSWMLSFLLVIVLPLEVYYTLQNEDDQIDYEISDIWTSFYWINFALTWFFLPISKNYEESGDFTFKDRLLRSIKTNLMIYAIGAIIFIILLIYLIVKNNMSANGVLAILAVTSNGFGLVVIVVLLGYGLVAIPRYLFREKEFSIRLKDCYSKLYKNNYSTTSTEFDLEEHIISLFNLQNKYKNNLEFQEYFEIILIQIPITNQEQARKSLYQEAIDVLAEINKRTKELILKVNRLKDNHDQISEQTLYLEDQLECLNKTSIYSEIRPKPRGVMGQCLGYIQWVWHCRIRKYVVVAMSIIFGIISILIILAQCSIFLPQINANIFSLMLNDNEPFIVVQVNQYNKQLIQQILCLIPLGYTLYCIQYALFSIEVSGVYGFYKNRNTDASSLLFAATFASRVSFPLSFNFLEMVDVNQDPLTQVAGNFNLDSYFVSFEYMLPILLILITLFNLFSLYDRILKCLGMTRFQFEHDYTDDNISEGQNLIKTIRRQKELVSNNTLSYSVSEPLNSKSQFQ